VRRPLGRIAIIKHARTNLSEADWGAFVERYGLTSGVVIMPPDVSKEDEAAFMQAAQDVAEGGSGALPHGSTYEPNSGDKGRGAGPFKEHLKHWQEKLVLVGTNGMLTMLTQSGSGTLAGAAHADTFDQLARGDARAVSELINAQLVRPYLSRQFPGQPISARWELAFREEVDGSAVVEDAAKLRSAGFRMDPAELGEKTGYKVTAEAVPGTEVGGQRSELGAPLITNRAKGEADETGGDSLDAMLASLLRGGVDAWTDAMAAAVKAGAESVPDEDETNTEE
jgi:phage gp29-like protein